MNKSKKFVSVFTSRDHQKKNMRRLPPFSSPRRPLLPPRPKYDIRGGKNIRTNFDLRRFGPPRHGYRPVPPSPPKQSATHEKKRSESVSKEHDKEQEKESRALRKKMFAVFLFFFFLLVLGVGGYFAVDYISKNVSSRRGASTVVTTDGSGGTRVITYSDNTDNTIPVSPLQYEECQRIRSNQYDPSISDKISLSEYNRLMASTCAPGYTGGLSYENCKKKFFPDATPCPTQPPDGTPAPSVALPDITAPSDVSTPNLTCTNTTGVDVVIVINPPSDKTMVTYPRVVTTLKAGGSTKVFLPSGYTFKCVPSTTTDGYCTDTQTDGGAGVSVSSEKILALSSPIAVKIVSRDLKDSKGNKICTYLGVTDSSDTLLTDEKKFTSPKQPVSNPSTADTINKDRINTSAAFLIIIGFIYIVICVVLFGVKKNAPWENHIFIFLLFLLALLKIATASTMIHYNNRSFFQDNQKHTNMNLIIWCVGLLTAIGLSLVSYFYQRVWYFGLFIIVLIALLIFLAVFYFQFILQQQDGWWNAVKTRS